MRKIDQVKGRFAEEGFKAALVGPMFTVFFKNAWPLLLLCLLATATYTYKLSDLSFENYDHFQFVKIAQEMMQSGNPMAMTYNGDPYMNKPHLLFWSIWLCSLPFGSINTLSARLPAVLSAIGCIVLVYLMSKELFNRTTAVFSSLILLSSYDFAMNARRVRFDIMLTMFTLLSLYLLLKGCRSEKRKLLWYSASGVAFALALLTKGPPALIHILLPFSLFLLVTGKPRTEWANFLAAVGVAGVILGGWLLLYIRIVGLNELVGVFNYEVVERIEGTRGIQLRPFYYYFYSVPGGLLPWSPLTLLLIPFLLKKSLWRREDYIFPLLWFLPVFLLLSMLPPKETRFAFPEFPPLAILIGAMCSEAAHSLAAGRLGRKLSALIAAPACVASPVLILIALIIPFAPEKINPATLYVAIFFLLLSLPLTYLFIRSSQAHKVFYAASLLALFGIFAVAMRVSVLAAENEERSPYQALYYRNEAVRQSRLYCYRFASDELDFYNWTPIENLQDTPQLAQVLEEEGPVTVFMPDEEFKILPRPVQRRLAVIDKVKLRRGKGTLLLVQQQTKNRLSLTGEGDSDTEVFPADLHPDF